MIAKSSISAPIRSDIHQQDPKKAMITLQRKLKTPIYIKVSIKDAEMKSLSLGEVSQWFSNYEPFEAARAVSYVKNDIASYYANRGVISAQGKYNYPQPEHISSPKH
eukprot:snap_masked-scaffold_42-processed-gene-1.25-mRNA-1 protein AED:1.00 eAED:1.00 QI:0/0/0/0/1/1/2/0/106